MIDDFVSDHCMELPSKIYVKYSERFVAVRYTPHPVDPRQDTALSSPDQFHQKMNLSLSSNQIFGFTFSLKGILYQYMITATSSTYPFICTPSIEIS